METLRQCLDPLQPCDTLDLHDASWSDELADRVAAALRAAPAEAVNRINKLELSGGKGTSEHLSRIADAFTETMTAQSRLGNIHMYGFATGTAGDDAAVPSFVRLIEKKAEVFDPTTPAEEPVQIMYSPPFSAAGSKRCSEAVSVHTLLCIVYV